MKKIAVSFFCILLLLSGCKTQDEKTITINVIPKPIAVEAGHNHLTWSDEVTLVAVSDDEKMLRLYCRNF